MFAIGLSGVFSLGGWCRLLQTGFLRSRPTQDPPTCRLLAGTGLSPSADGLPRPFPFTSFHDIGVLQPRACRNTPGLGSSAFARHYLRNHSYFLFLRVLRCFSSPRLPPSKRVTTSLWPGCPIRKSPDQRLFAPPRSLSQLITSFLASESQGIPHALLVTFSNFLLVFFFSRSAAFATASRVKLFSSSMSMNFLLPLRKFSGGSRTRTEDPLLAKQVLYQLS